MYAPLKTKGSKKNKEKVKETIEDGIPDVPQLHDFQLIDIFESSSPKNETIFSSTSDLARAIDELDLEEKNNEEKKERQDVDLPFGSQQVSSICEVEKKVDSDTIRQAVEDIDIIDAKDDSNIEENVSLVNQPLQINISDNTLLEVKKSEDLQSFAVEDKQNEETSETLINDTILENESLHQVEEPLVEEIDGNLKDDSPDSKILEEKEIEDEKISGYLSLTTTVKSLMNEISEPSAPSVEGKTSVSFPSVLHTQEEKKVLTPEKPIDVSKYNFSMVVENFLPPFSDEKLSEYYYNSELNESKKYVNEFINQETNCGGRGNNEFYKLLVEYLKSKNSLKSNEAKVQDIKEKIEVCTSTMWSVWDDVKVTDKEKCSDGVIVHFVEKYTQAQFNPNILQEFSSLLTEIKQVVYESHVMDSFSCSTLRLKIEYYLQCLLTSCPEFTNLDERSPIVLSEPSSDSHFQQCLIDLRSAISILFSFQRKQSLDVGNCFLQETREWLSDLVSVLLRVGSWKDHIFLLNHVLRCPGGVSDWATHFIQTPFNKAPGDSEINHMMTVINFLLSPIEQRENFIKKWESELTSEVNPWTVIDSDGEVEDDEEASCPLKENDLVSLLNQVPFCELFKTILQYNGKEIANGVVTSSYLLRLFSFFTDLIKVFLSGLKLYSTERYRQFTKRLGRLICHIVQYATNALTVYKSQSISEDESIRIQVEYDNFFLRSTKFVFSAKKHGAWQFLATMPYSMASSNAILKLYGILQLNDDGNESLVRVNFPAFEEKFLSLPEEEQFYLLTTFANMALARDVVEMSFIKNILLQLFYIGFLSTATMEHCYKNVKSLLCSICSSHPYLISEILFIQNNMFLAQPNQPQNLSIYLWSKLPLDLWCPEKRDFDVLSIWLLEPIQSVHNELARIILQSLNYGIIQGEPFISMENHKSIAMMVLQSNIKLVKENEGVMKNMSTLVRSQNPEQMLNDWTWSIMLKLRLHLLDQSDANICKCLGNLESHLQNIPDVESNAELHHLVLKKHPVGCFVALMTTTLGHSVPIIFEKGFELVDVLLNAGKFEAGIACIEYMTFLFLDCSDSLYKCEKFMFIISRLIAADNTYVQMAKNLISSNFPGPVLKCLEIMLQNQLNCCKNLNLQKFSNIIQLWFNVFTKIPLWMQEPGVLYLIDRLLQNSFFDGISAKLVTAALEDLLEACSPPSETKSSLSSLVSWMNSKYNPPSLLPRGFSGEVPWFAYKVIQMEFEIHEKKNSIWVELLKELYSCNEKKTNIDNSLKKICNNLRVPVRPSGVLAIYKWSYQILETEFSHPLLPLIWQRFFYLYLYRVPGLIDRGSVGSKFFDGVLNQALFKKLKQRLEENLNYFKTLNEQTEKNIEDDYYLRCFKLFQAYALWLVDPKLHETTINIHMLPVQYNPELLGLIIHGSEAPWIEFLEYQNIEESFRNCSLEWFKIKTRSDIVKRSKILNHKKEKSFLEKMDDRLHSYELPLPPPQVNFKKYGFTKVSLDVLINSDKMILFVKPFIKVLLDYVQQYTTSVNENVSIGCDMQDLLPRMYLTAETRKVLKKHCTGLNKTINGKTVHYACCGPAVVTLTFEESRVNEQVKKHFNQCENSFLGNLQKAMASLPAGLITAAVLIDIAIEELKKEYNAACNRKYENKIVAELKGTGVHLFYELIRTWCESITHTPPLERAFQNYIEVLGKNFVEGNAEESDRILHLILNDDLFGEKICKYFTPNASPNHDFIENYLKALKCSSERRFAILSKFDIAKWLQAKKTKYMERSRMINAVGTGLKLINSVSEEKTTLKLLNQHLEALLMYDFPEHYGEVLNFLLEASESQTLPTSTWFMFLNSLAFGQFAFTEGKTNQNIFEPGQSVKKLKYYFSKFATDQKLIPFEVIKGTITLLASSFKSERLKSGAYGLFRKYRQYIEPIFIFYGMLSYSCVAKALEIDTGSLSDKIAQQLWPLLSDLYSPWMVPYSIDKEKDQAGQCAQDQNYDRNIFLPWAINDSCHASFCASVFSESIRFLFDALPGLNHVLSYTWYFYVVNFAHIHVKDYVLNIVHDSLACLPWDAFVPSLQDVELMLKVVDQFLPLSHSFLGSIFINIKWTELVQYYSGYYDLETTTKLHICLIHLLVKLPLEPSLKQNDKIITLLTEAKEYSWHLIDSGSYDIVLNWFIMSCDPRIILMDERLEYYKLDSTILRLLQSCAGYIPTAKAFHPTTLTKRLMFVRACVKWLTTSHRRYKSASSPLYTSALFTLWNDMENIINETVPVPQKIDEAGILLSEFLSIFAESELSTIIKNTFSNWLSTRRSTTIIFGLFRSVGIAVEDPNLFGSITEVSLESYFEFTENCDWSEVIKILVPFSKSKSDAHLEKTLSDNNYFLTLYAVLMKRLERNEHFNSSTVVLTDLLQLLQNVKPSCDLEPKIILLVALGLKLVESKIKLNVKEGISYLIKFSDIMNNFVNDKNSGFLSALGLKKSGSSNRFKLVSLVICSGIITFLKINYPEHHEAVDEKILQAMELADSNKMYQNIHQYASYAKTVIKEITTVEQIVNFVKHIGLKLFNKLYLK